MLHNQETEVAKIIRPNVCKHVYWDKTGACVRHGGGTAIYDTDRYLDIADIDMDFFTNDAIEEANRKGHKGARFFYRDIPFKSVKEYYENHRIYRGKEKEFTTTG
jgi:hypothetical protein